MNQKIQPYKYDLCASISILLVIIIGNFVDHGESSELKILGISLLILSIFFWIAPVFTLKKYGHVERGKNYFETRMIVVKDIYSIIRHPQYLAYTLFVFGFAFIYQNWITFVMSIIAAVFIYVHTFEEDKELMIKFPQDYRNYCENVPRFNFIKSVLVKITKNGVW
ncbi:MAG: isoprenylcysteine carboxylmethyltransferase family protein [Candidatus Marinimicrobia bacterium]|jgi:protein-S-isoprenylcysteine O-methyltransferase Ste14|nr:isoprenylcysteine carboxylmethyltransferase family protein [Candidatus Neomarinimicrobiota bacterium]MBT3683632.1 isoprenylcysteine carboxylmethyltransferase family protein [Candidatus Neomarinimicrobiota bacterium]MBT3760411.1 isoprenylcysteine carboxylmethyltransferase family protein [Candidatus Neomarinimicrobiota bacterium]MBT3896511.1 isoprenylcysteine carboxylmethyltransferase family protein [Candidatus Neomarinimicrobiota bacterium]MBT4173575.1 isoprenylcysteine carboxylmethyltransfer